MSDLAIVAVLVPLAYLLGTFPSAELVARRGGVDINAQGSGNPGASNTFRLLGWKAGALVFGLDFAKGALAAGLGILVDGHRGAFILGGAAIIGHTLPITRRFKGGRGVATGAGVVFVIFPLLTLGGGVLWFVVVRLTHKASVASITVMIAFPFAVAAAGHSVTDIVVISCLSLLVIARHFSNLRRLVKGEELGLDPGAEPGGDPGPAG
ncbi:MAG: glycerol-3-phosphate acyltransferase [Acidimicrobiia bacterium]